MIKLLIIFSILIFPFQFLSYQTAYTGDSGSSYHFSCFIFILISFLSLLTKGKISLKTIIFFALFFLIQFILVYFFQVAPINRFISGLVFFGGLLLVYSQSSLIKLDPRTIFKCIVFPVTLSAFIALIQYVILGIDRPKAFFAEPSTSGLVFFSMASAILCTLVNFRVRLKYKYLLVIILILTFFMGILSKSMHIITFLLVLAIFLLPRFCNRFLSKYSFYFLLKSIYLAFLAPPVIVISMRYIDFDHIYQRLGLSSSSSSNISYLSWLRGLDQALASVNMSPLFGLGLGSTGYFDFYSVNTISLESYKVGYLNLTDAYSLALRLIIEVGIVFSFIFMYVMFKQIVSFRKFVSLTQNSTSFVIISTYFNYIFSLSIVIGCLIKEPVYSQSYLYVAIFILSSFKLLNAHEGSALMYGNEKNQVRR